VPLATPHQTAGYLLPPLSFLRESGQQEKAFKMWAFKQILKYMVMSIPLFIAEVIHELAIIHKANNNKGMPSHLHKRSSFDEN
jgi:hypothetical protein